jgi:hypothetical protein
MHAPAGPMFLDLTDPRASDPHLAGTFAAPLARAVRSGAPVPVTAVLTAEACRRLAALGDVEADYHIPGRLDTPAQDPAIEALALAWHLAGFGGVLPVVLHVSPVTPYDHPAGWRAGVPIPTWRRLRAAVVEAARTRPAAVVLQREVTVTTSGRAWPGDDRASSPDGLDRGQARRLARIAHTLETPFRWAVDTTGNVWVLACVGVGAGTDTPSVPAPRAVA